MTDRELMQQALEELEFFWDNGYRNIAMKQKATMDALRERLARPNEFEPDWDEVEALRGSLREHMAEIKRLRAVIETNLRDDRRGEKNT